MTSSAPSERVSSVNGDLTTVAALGLQTAILESILAELRAHRVADRSRAWWHTAIGAVVGVACFGGLWLLLPAGLVLIK